MALDLQKLLELHATLRKMKRELGVASHLSALPAQPGWGKISEQHRYDIVKAMLADPNFPPELRGHINLILDVILKQTEPAAWFRGRK